LNLSLVLNLPKFELIWDINFAPNWIKSGIRFDPVWTGLGIRFIPVWVDLGNKFIPVGIELGNRFVLVLDLFRQQTCPSLELIGLCCYDLKWYDMHVLWWHDNDDAWNNWQWLIIDFMKWYAYDMWHVYVMTWYEMICQRWCIKI